MGGQVRCWCRNQDYCNTDLNDRVDEDNELPANMISSHEVGVDVEYEDYEVREFNSGTPVKLEADWKAWWSGGSSRGASFPVIQVETTTESVEAYREDIVIERNYDLKDE
ncbi:unnamed protein product [Heligmosomoides polygyrus]|uniref:SH3 domain-containing protein n=1 Tax=Heligmosomoides polygyrus TaxID=6339 RepID=A0A183G0G1_HELPZ|nr:unnamed protein product [Heligmosomoides polygyrus]